MIDTLATGRSVVEWEEKRVKREPMAPRGTSATSGLEIVRVPITDLHEDAENARRHSKENIGAVKASLKEFGQQKPIVVDHQDKIVAGNATWIAARQLGWHEIDVVYTDLVGARQRAFAVTDNRSAELAEWNLDLLAQHVGETLDALPWQDLGWSPGALDALLGTGAGAEGADPDVWGSEISDTPEKEKAQIRERVKTISLTKDQREIFEQACTRIREQYANPDLTEGACVEIMAAARLGDEPLDEDRDERQDEDR